MTVLLQWKPGYWYDRNISVDRARHAEVTPGVFLRIDYNSIKQAFEVIACFDHGSLVSTGGFESMDKAVDFAEDIVRGLFGSAESVVE